jgi:hypothetical protein
LFWIQNSLGLIRSVTMPAMNDPENKAGIAGQCYAEAIRLRKVADLLIEKSEIISHGYFDPTNSALNRIVAIDSELELLGWPQPAEPAEPPAAT